MSVDCKEASRRDGLNGFPYEVDRLDRAYRPEGGEGSGLLGTDVPLKIMDLLTDGTMTTSATTSIITTTTTTTTANDSVLLGRYCIVGVQVTELVVTDHFDGQVAL